MATTHVAGQSQNRTEARRLDSAGNYEFERSQIAQTGTTTGNDVGHATYARSRLDRRNRSSSRGCHPKMSLSTITIMLQIMSGMVSRKRTA